MTPGGGALLGVPSTLTPLQLTVGLSWSMPVGPYVVLWDSYSLSYRPSTPLRTSFSPSAPNNIPRFSSKVV